MSRVDVDEHLAKILDPDFRADLILRGVAASISAEIKQKRKALGLGQAELAQLLETTQSRISQMEDPNYGKLSLTALAKLADAFDCTLEVSFKSRRLSASTMPPAMLQDLTDWMHTCQLRDNMTVRPNCPNIIHFNKDRKGLLVA